MERRTKARRRETSPTTERWRGYAVAVAGTALAALVRWALGRAVGGEIPPYITFYPVVLAAAVTGGTRPGVLATILSTLAVDLLFLEPVGKLRPATMADGVGLGLFIAISLAISVVGGRLRAVHQRTRRQARDLDELLAAIVENSEDAILSEGLDGMVTSWNPAAERLYGYRAEEIIGRPLALIIPPERQGEETASLERLRLGEHIAPYESVRMTRDGQRIDVFVTFSPLRDLAGRIVGASKIVRDITERKQVEAVQKQRAQELQRANEDLRQSEGRLRESEQRLRLAWATAKLGFYERNIATNQAVYDPQLRAMLGLTGDEDVLSPDTARNSVHPEDRERVLAAVARVLDPAIRENASQEYRIIRPDGEVRWLAGSARAIFEGQGASERAVKLLGVAQDITERKRAAGRQAALLAELQAANRELNDFATIVSHDLKTPLRGVATLAKWLQSDYGDRLDQEGREYLAEMVKRTGRMDRMIEDILQYSRAGRSRENPEPVALAELMPAVVQDLAPPAHVRLRIAPGLPIVQGESVRLRQVFQNLIGNAIKHGDKTPLEIQVGWADNDSLWQFSVEDNGPGIEQRHFERIFKIFQTLAPKDKTDSTGVGLALVKRIVERAGGRVWVESRVGEGSAFHFTWPKQMRAE